MTIKDVIDYVDRVKKNEFTTEEKTRWINEIEGYVQIQIMLLAQPECISYCYSSESEQSGISFPADNQMRLPRKLKAHVGGFLKIEGLVTYPENNLSGLAILSISDNGKLIEFEQGTFPQTGETPESAIAQIAFDGQDTELLVPAPFERLYYEYVLAKISENLEENSAQNNRLATFDETWQNFAEWYANTYRPGDGKAIFKGYYITGKQGVPGLVGPRGENLYNVGLSTSADGITADKRYDELVEQLEAGIMVVPIVDGVAFVSNAVKNDNTIVFTAADDSVSPVLKGYSVNSSNVWTKFTKLLPTEAQLNSKYTKPASGIPKADLANDVQASLGKAETALQEHQSLAAYRTSADQDVIDGLKQDKLIAGENITIAEDGKTISAAGGVSNAIGYFEVTLTKQADGSYTSSKTYAQVKEEIANNNCFMLIDGYDGVFILTRIGGVTVEFAGMLDGTDGWMRVEVSSDERWEVIPEPRITLDWYNGLVEDIGKLKNLTTADKSNLVAAVNEVKGIADNKQAKLIAGENITIAADGKTISATGGGGSTIELDTTLSETGKAADAKAVGDALADKQDIISDLEAIRTGASKGATALQSVPSSFRTAAAQDVIDSGKVDKVTGKGLSSNDYTDADKTKVDTLARVAESGSYNDLIDQPVIPSVPTATINANTAARHEHSNKTVLDLISETVKAAWDAASTWVTTNGANVISHLSDSIKHITASERSAWNGKQDKLIAGENITIAADGKTISATGGGGGVSGDNIETVEAQQIDIPAKLSDFENDSGFVTNSAVEAALADKQDTISDLENIRSGAGKGATALQAVPSTYRTASAQDVVDNGLDDRISAIEGKEAGWNGKYSKPTGGIPKADLSTAVQASLGKADSALQSHQSLAAYRTASAQDTIDSGKVDKVTGKGLSTNDYTNTAKAKVDAIPANPKYTDTVYNDTAVKSRLSTVEGKLNGSGAVTFSAVTTDSLTTEGEVEIYGTQPHIDFHYNNSSDDYTSRIIETSNGQLNLSAANGVLINGKKTENEAVTLTADSSRITNVAYTAKYNELLGAVFVRIYGTINASLNVGYDYDLFSINSRLPNSVAALSVKCGKNAMAVAKAASGSGAIQIRPLEAGINSYDVYITGFWFV